MVIILFIQLALVVFLVASVVFLVMVLWRTMKACESMARSLKHLAANKTQSDPH